MQTPSDLAPVRAVVDAYVEATRTRDVPALEQVFHPQALMTGWFQGAQELGGPEPFYRNLEKMEVADDYAAEILHLHVDGDIGLASLVEENLFGLSFVNHFHLIREEALGWRIISKLWRHA